MLEQLTTRFTRQAAAAEASVAEIWNVFSQTRCGEKTLSPS